MIFTVQKGSVDVGSSARTRQQGRHLPNICPPSYIHYPKTKFTVQKTYIHYPKGDNYSLHPHLIFTIQKYVLFAYFHSTIMFTIQKTKMYYPKN